MSLVTSLLQKFGFVGPLGLRNLSLERLLILTRRIPSISVPRSWHSESSARSFQSEYLARRAFYESVAKVPVAR